MMALTLFGAARRNMSIHSDIMYRHKAIMYRHNAMAPAVPALSRDLDRAGGAVAVEAPAQGRGGGAGSRRRALTVGRPA